MLTERGHRRAALAASAIASLGRFSAIVCSPEQGCIQTANYVATILGLPVHIVRRFCRPLVGDENPLPHLASSRTPVNISGVISSRLVVPPAADDNPTFPDTGRESVLRRHADALDDIFGSILAEETVLAVTHASTHSIIAELLTPQEAPRSTEVNNLAMSTFIDSREFFGLSSPTNGSATTPARVLGVWRLIGYGDHPTYPSDEVGAAFLSNPRSLNWTPIDETGSPIGFQWDTHPIPAYLGDIWHVDYDTSCRVTTRGYRLMRPVSPHAMSQVDVGLVLYRVMRPFHRHDLPPMPAVVGWDNIGPRYQAVLFRQPRARSPTPVRG